MYGLVPHPDHPPVAAKSLRVSLHQTRGLVIDFHLYADTSQLLIPEPARSERADELWKTTCFELFVKGDGGSAYCEFNFSPSTQWASYAFRDYREGMHETPTRALIHTSIRPSLLAMTVLLHADFSRDSHLGLSAVVEEKDGRKSYWALAHPDGPPDFHDPHCFTLPMDGIATQ